MSTITKEKYGSYDSNILEALFLKYSVSKYYIRQCIRGVIKAPLAKEIKNDYIIMEEANRQTVLNLLRKTLE